MSDPSQTTIGIDFGTTNTVVAMADHTGESLMLSFDAPSGKVTAFRSALSFQTEPARGERPPQRLVEAGPWAIDAYVEEALDTRFVQSFKTFAASAAFTETTIDNRRYRFEDLLGAFLLQLRRRGGEAMAALPARVIVGRPVTFAGGSPDEALALRRYEDAFARLGFTDIRFAYEPVGAAFFFARTLKADATVLVADFSGGTSDFSIVRYAKTDEGLQATPLARSGVGAAGDAFDYRIIDQLVSPELGKGSAYRSLGKTLPVPQRYYAAFARWDQLALLGASRDMRDIRALARTATEPEKLERLIEILDDNHGYALINPPPRSRSRCRKPIAPPSPSRPVPFASKGPSRAPSSRRGSRPNSRRSTPPSTPPSSSPGSALNSSTGSSSPAAPPSSPPYGGSFSPGSDGIASKRGASSNPSPPAWP
jgi:hypothetical chaperone protein